MGLLNVPDVNRASVGLVGLPDLYLATMGLGCLFDADQTTVDLATMGLINLYNVDRGAVDFVVVDDTRPLIIILFHDLQSKFISVSCSLLQHSGER